MLSNNSNRYVATFGCCDYQTTYIGGDTMKIFEVANLLYTPKDKKLGEMLFVAKMKERKKSNRKIKEPKGKAEDGSYCPKSKFGQSWAYTKEKVEKEDDREDVA